MKEGYKYPKDIIQRLDVFEKEFGIEELSLNVFYDFNWGNYNYINVVGEIIAEKITDELLLAITIYNENGEPIGVDYSEKISMDNFDGLHTFKVSLKVPIKEEIKKILVYFIKNPSSI